MIRVTFHCHKTEESQIVHGSSLSDLLNKACDVFNMDLDTVDLWYGIFTIVQCTSVQQHLPGLQNLVPLIFMDKHWLIYA